MSIDPGRPGFFPRPPSGFMRRMLADTFSDLRRPMRSVRSVPPEINSKELRVWFIGHATVLINFFGTTILTDPVFVNWIPFPRRVAASGIGLKDLPAIDHIVISHPHMDHLNRPSLRRLASKTGTLVLPKNSRDLVRPLGFKNVLEMDWGRERESDDGLTIRAFKAKHWGKRVPWEKIERGYNCYVLSKNGVNVFFGGDTGYGPVFSEVGARYAIDVALLPIGAYSPRSFMEPFHMDPADAVKAFLDLKAEHFIPIHWGSFRLSLEPMDEPPKLLAELGAKENISGKIHVLQNGESWTSE